jgi:hypothetical protein
MCYTFCCIRLDHIINSKCLRRIELNVWIEFCYELFICRVFVHKIIWWKYLLGIKEYIWIKSWYVLFILLCVRRSYNQFEMFPSNWAKYLNRILLWIIHLSCVRWSQNDVEMVDCNWVKYFNRTFVWNTHLLRVPRLCNQL